MRVLSRAVLVGCLALALAAVGAAEGGKKFHRAIDAKSRRGPHYLKVNLPYVSGSHVMGTYKRPLVICSQDGLNTKGAAEFSGSWFHAEGRTTSLRINDVVRIDETDWDGDERELDIELKAAGRSRGRGEGVVKFSELRELADFDRCWDEVFSDVSIETRYDWPEEIRRAVVSRRVEQGMTRDMVLVALGNPDRITRTHEGGADHETWFVPLGRGLKVGYLHASGSFEMALVRFVDGRVTEFDSDGDGAQLKVR